MTRPEIDLKFRSQRKLEAARKLLSAALAMGLLPGVALLESGDKPSTLTLKASKKKRRA